MSPASPAIYLIAYDITADGRRKKVMHAVEKVGQRVNYSVFEASLTPAALDALLTTLTTIINTRRDHIRVYPLSRRTVDDLIVLGRDRPSCATVTVV